MHAVLTATGRRALKLQTPFEEFLHGRGMRRRAERSFCDPEDLILDHLPEFEASDADEAAEAFAEACEQATGGLVSNVVFSDEDIHFTRRHFLHSRRFRYVMPMPTEAA